MNKQGEGNEDWVKREMGRIPTKGAMAAERASAGLGTSDDDSGFVIERSSPITPFAKSARKTQQPDKQ